MRNTAPYHTRRIYNSSELASNIYQRYFLHLSAEEKENNLPHLDSKWQKDQATVAIIKACPFCDKPCPGNLAHLHQYCQNKQLLFYGSTYQGPITYYHSNLRYKKF
jgi:hypothetical protein